MSTTVIVGSQWGDEGKGKITDMLAERADMVVRYQGGNNAGHTVVVGDKEFKLHLVPSGILYPHTVSVIGGGVVVDPAVLLQELDGLQGRDVDVSGLRISETAHLIMPYHRLIDVLEEKGRGTAKIGTTGRGIGPAYADKVSRCGIRVADLMKPDTFRARLASVLEVKNSLLEKFYGEAALDYDTIVEEYLALGQRIRPYVADTSLLVSRAVRNGDRVIFEGAQGTLLDLDHGTYPYVTSSHPIAGGACLGTGVGPTDIKRIIGIAKAYTTRVGEGPFPTELFDDDGDRLREVGREYGTTTGRPRRCGWADAVILRYAVMVNGLSEIALTKLDVLTGLPTIKICNGYKVDGRILERFPDDLDMLSRCEPIYEEMPGWREDISGALKMEDLPENTRNYVEALESMCGVTATLVSVGPARNQTIVRGEGF